ncbi:MAG: single-stranded-DNA-specific exonuclease RecJ [Holosporaceae bacterium]|nr:single-stranded-DNA-specific exonuclease RecJ [Holosporaceae bacterium]
MKYRITSITNRIWNIQEKLTEASDIVEILAKNREIALDAFLNTSIKNSLPDPFVFVDMEKVVHRIVDAIKSRQKIAILGDYDVDGVSSVSIFIKLLEHIGADYTYVIPSRVDDGYGLNIANIERHKECLIIAVDCGSSSVEELAYAKNNHIDVIVIDHHRMSTIPESYALVNPHRPDEKGTYKYLCATGLVFICIVGVNRLLKKIGFYAENVAPNLLEYLDLVALATICDVMELCELNRAFVQSGLKIIRQRQNLGIDALLSMHKSACINTETISFFLGPRLNAAGRMDQADLSVRLLTTKNPIEAKRIAVQLENLNNERRTLEQEMVTEAISLVKEDQNFICIYNPSWRLGIIGIIASRLKDKYQKPVIVISCDPKGMGKASCRSVENVNISDIIKKGIQQEIIVSGGGHAMAAGFSINIPKIRDLLEFLATNIERKTSVPELYADCITPLNFITTEFVETISVLEPFGMGNRYPKFVIPNVKIISARVVGENHIAFSLVDENGNIVRAISFRSFGTSLGNVLLEEASYVCALGSAVISCWNNQRYVSFQLEDISQSVMLE